MKRGKLTESIVNMVLGTSCVLGKRGDVVMIHETFDTYYEVSTEAHPSITFYANKSQVELS